ncbi:MAG: VOC family protein [Flavobacteriaceae bacterium]|nr:VOC family protein [Flavobacteriaceae bacterium]
MKKIYILFLFLGFTIAASAQTEIKPHTIGIVVSDIKKATKWYEDVLELKLYKKLSFPKYDSLKIYFLKNKHFQLELLEKKTSFSIHKYVSNYSLNDKPQIGFSKIAFSITKIDSFYKRLKNKGVTIVLGITEDKEFNSKYFIIKDLDNNVLQFIEQQ